jgi:hypothetical protein
MTLLLWGKGFNNKSGKATATAAGLSVFFPTLRKSAKDGAPVLFAVD